MDQSNETGSTWAQFRLKHNWGTGKKTPRKESKKSRTKRLKGTTHNKTKKKTTQTHTQFHQFSLDGDNISLNDAEAFADIMRDKQPGTIRLALQNIQMLPDNAKHYKSRQLVNHICQAELDGLLINEVGLNWRAISAANQWVERTIGKLNGSKAIFAHNTTEDNVTEAIQYGGVGIVTTHELAHRIIESGSDTTNLGRWAWIRIQGKEGHTVRIATAYRPCESPGASTVFHQQARGLSKNNDHRNPRDAFIEDLQDDIKLWLATGDHIIIGLDANEDVRTGAVSKTFANLGLREAILDKHKEQSPPATQNRNMSRTPIDGIWVSGCINISAGGYLPFGDACPSDHRMIWIEIQFSIAFGQRPPDIVKIRPQRLKTSDPRLVAKYNTRVKKTMRESGFRKRFESFKLQLENNEWNDDLIDQYDALDKEDRLNRTITANGIRKLHMGGVPWSPQLQIHRQTIELWQMIRRKRKGMKISLKRIRRFMQKTRIRDALSNNLEQTEQLLAQAYCSYRTARQHAQLWRNNFLESLAKAKADKLGTQVETELKSLIQIEKQRRQARNIKRMRGKLGSGQVTKVYQTEEDGTKTVCETQNSMVKAFFQENDSRFSQTEDTPPMQTPLAEDLGYLAETEKAAQVLNGSYEPTLAIDPYARELLHEMRMPECVRRKGMISKQITTAEHIQGWKKTPERAAEQSGPSMAEMKASSQDTVLAELDTFMRNVPYQKGFSPRSWRLITDVEILKKAGVYDVEKMRTIQLMHSVFNMNNKRMGRAMMSSAEECNILAREQFGSRKNHQSITAALNKRLTMDLLRQRRQAGALCSNDAKSCYDRIVHNVASLAIRRTGMPAEPALSMFETLQKAEHRVTTAYGISTKTYGKNRTIPYQGVGQGNGAGPAIWAVISTVIIAMMTTAGHGFHLLSAISTTLINMVCYAFVDDTDVIQSAADVNEPGESVIPKMQCSVDRWEGGLRATGGALVPAKSHWYLIDFKWTGKLWQYRNEEDMPGELSILDTTGARVILDRHEPHIATETLGVWQAMDGNNKVQIAQLRKKTEEFAECMRTGFLSKNDAWHAINTTIMKTLEYPMTATTIKEKEWEHIMAPVLKAGLPRAGFARTFPRDVLYGPAAVQGLDVFHPWYHQELQHLIVLMQHTQQQTLTGQLLRTSYEQLRLEIGTSGYMTDTPFKTMKTMVTDTWLTDLWEFVDRFQIQIRDDVDILKLQRTNDKLLMDEFINVGCVGSDLQLLNECRMFLQAVTLSDIVSADGRQITINAWEGKQDDKGPSPYQWPRTQSTLSAAHWKVWRRILEQTFISCGPRGLKEPLLEWIEGVPPQWKWFFCPREDRLYAKEGLFWRSYSRHRVRTSPRQGRSKYLKTNDLLRERPTGLQTASVVLSGTIVLLTGSGNWLVEQPKQQTPKPEFFEQARKLRPLGDRWAIQEISITDNGIAIAQAIRNGTAIAVSDGSYKDGRGTSAFILEVSDQSDEDGRIVGVNSIPGEQEDQTSYRSEAGGVSGIVETVGIICAIHGITAGAIEVGLDGEQAMKTIFGTWPLHPKQADYDLLKDLRAKIKRSPLTWTGVWVEGHQDKSKTFDELDRRAQLNVECDGLAKDYWNSCMEQDDWLPNNVFADEGWSVWIEGKKLTRLDIQTLYNYVFSKRTKAYWSRKHYLTDDMITNINWEACQKSLSKLPFGKRRWLIKQATGFCGIGKMEKIRGNQDHDECPRCGKVEDAPHVVLCKGTGTDLTFSVSLQKLEITLRDKYTAPDITYALTTRIRQWRKYARRTTRDQATPFPRYTHHDEFGTHRAVSAQDKIGWYNLLLGRMAQQWTDAQQKYLESIGKKTTGKRWAIAIIAKLWDIAWDMWEQRNHIKHNTLHPRKQQAMEVLGQRLAELYAQGSANLLPRDRPLFQKSLETLQKGTANEQEQWILSTLLAHRRAASAQEDRKASMQVERRLMEQWLGMDK